MKLGEKGNAFEEAESGQLENGSDGVSLGPRSLRLSVMMFTEEGSTSFEFYILDIFDIFDLRSLPVFSKELGSLSPSNKWQLWLHRFLAASDRSKKGRSTHGASTGVRGVRM